MSALGEITGYVIWQRLFTWPRWLPVYLYIRLSLRTSITAADARKVVFLFDDDLNGAWCTLGYLRSLDRAIRVDALKFNVNVMADRLGLPRPFGASGERTSAHQARPQERGHGEAAADWPPESETEFNIPESAETLASLRELGLTTLPRSFGEIRRAYRRKIQEYHPDKFVGAKPEIIRCAEEIAKNINTAYGYLEEVCQGR